MSEKGSTYGFAPSKQYGLMIFDFDGTLRSISVGAIYHGWLAIFRRLEIDHTKFFATEQEFNIHFRSADWHIMAQRAEIPREQYTMVNAVFQEEFHRRCTLFQWVEYVISAIARLSDTRLAVWSSSTLHSVQSSLGGLESYFVPIVTADHVRRLKPHTEGGAMILEHHLFSSIHDIHDAILIGDDEVDLIAARDLGIDAGFVTWGLGSMDLALRYPCTVITHPRELINFARSPYI